MSEKPANEIYKRESRVTLKDQSPWQRRGGKSATRVRESKREKVISIKAGCDETGSKGQRTPSRGCLHRAINRCRDARCYEYRQREGSGDKITKKGGAGE